MGATAFDFDALEDKSADAVACAANVDASSCPRGECCRCDCLEWLSVNELGANRSVPERPKTYGLKTAFLDDGVAMMGSMNSYAFAVEHCRRCGCHRRWHRDLSDLFSRLLHRGVLVEADTAWSDLERAIFRQTEGALRPSLENRCRGPLSGLVAVNGTPLVSVICPTCPNRRHWVESLHRNFHRQLYPVKQLVVVETGQDDAKHVYFDCWPDERVDYRYFKVGAVDWSIGAKRNVACCIAKGDIIVHFDDDDIYAPEYLNWMVQALFEGKSCEGSEVRTCETSTNCGEEKLQWPYSAAELATLSCWRTLHLASGKFSFCDAEKQSKEHHRREWTFGYGFSFVYLRHAWLEHWFRDISLGEDSDFAESLLARGARAAIVRDNMGRFCSHTHHPCNYSPWERDGDLPEEAQMTEGIFGDLARDLIRDISPLRAMFPDLGPDETVDMTPERTIRMLDELIVGFLDGDHQQKLWDSFMALLEQPAKQEAARREICLEVQGPVLESYGFEGSFAGLMKCANSFTVELNSIPEIAQKNRFLHWLARPAAQAVYPTLVDVDELRRAYRVPCSATPNPGPDPGSRCNLEQDVSEMRTQECEA